MGEKSGEELSNEEVKASSNSTCTSSLKLREQSNNSYKCVRESRSNMNFKSLHVEIKTCTPRST